MTSSNKIGQEKARHPSKNPFKKRGENEFIFHFLTEVWVAFSLPFLRLKHR